MVVARSIPGRMAGLRRMPLNVRLILQTSGATASWVKQLDPKPISEMKFEGDTLAPLKISAISVVTKELLQASGAVAEGWLRDALINALTEMLNVSFIDPANAGVVDVEPASIANGAPSVAATGVWADDLAALLGVFTGDLETAYFVTNGVTASGLSGPSQPNLTVRGGELSGVPAIVDKSVPTGVLVLADAAQIAYGEDALRLDAGTHASLLMDSAPAGPATFSLWQKNCVALRVEQMLNWQAAKPGAVAVLTGV